jgi:hypothetical protein
MKEANRKLCRNGKRRQKELEGCGLLLFTGSYLIQLQIAGSVQIFLLRRANRPDKSRLLAS